MFSAMVRVLRIWFSGTHLAGLCHDGRIVKLENVAVLELRET
jgi:hypothetical protein